MKINEFMAAVGIGLASLGGIPLRAQNVPQVPAGVTQEQPAQTSAPLRVMVGKSILINTSERLKRVSVTDPAVADALVVTPTQVMVHGRTPGEVSLLLWDENERSRTFDLRVDVDVTSAAEEIHSIFPDEKINVTASRSAVVLSGHVSDKELAERAGMIAGAYSKNVVNVLSFGPVGAQEILLEVKFAEVNRAAVLHPGRAEPDRGEWERSKLPRGRGIPLPGRTGNGWIEFCDHPVQGIRRAASLHSSHHAKWQHSPASES